MTRSITKLTLILTVAIGALFASQAHADVYDRIDRYAVKIENKTRQLLSETIHYLHTPQYRQLVQCTKELSRLATHIHDVTHFEGNLVRLRADLRGLEHEFQLLEGLFDQIEYAASRGYGKVKGNTAHVKSLLNSIERNICDISDCVETLVTPVVYKKPVYKQPVVYKQPAVYKKPVVVTRKPVYSAKNRSRNQGYRYGNYGNRGGGFGISIGGGSSRIVFGF